MRKIWLFSLVVITLSSCATYQYNTINSLSLNKDLSTGEFISETDTMKVVYNFYGENAPVRIKIYNKLDIPVHIDWSRSALIVGDEAIGYSGNKIDVSGDVLGNATRYNRSTSVVDASINATAVLPEGSTFIPPHSQVEKNIPSVKQMSVKVPSQAFTNVKLSPIQKIDAHVSDLNIKVADFSKGNSPLIFKSYLTFFLNKQQTAQSFADQHEFYISNVVRTSVSPKTYNDYIRKSGDVFIQAN